jgi:exopolysaccharide biosynthesis polyprenyl glycosylphosphotransferase
MNLSKKHTGLQIIDLIALLLTITIQILIQSIWVSKINYITRIGLNWITIRNLISLSLLFITWHAFFQFLAVYNTRRIGLKTQDILDVLKVSSIATFVLLVFSNIFWITFADKSFICAFWIGSSIAVLTARIIYKYLLTKYKTKSKDNSQILIVGTNERALRFAQKLNKNSFLGYRIVGFIDDHWTGLDNFNKERFNLIGRIDDLNDIIKKQVIDEVVICLPLKSYYSKINTLINICEEQGVLIRFTADFFDLKIARSSIDHLDGIPILTLYSAPVNRSKLIFKRLIDISLSVMILLIIAPLLPLIAIIIKIDNNGPVFFTQKRVGLNKRLFNLIKLRTMVVNAEELKKTVEKDNEVSGPVFKIKNDPRLTGLGKWLRKTSIDELPQLINVLIGDMSLVGPRPLPVRDYKGFNQNWYRRRFSVRPGITCLWQISGRNNIPFEQWMELDMEYIDNWSILTDFKILLKTIPAVIRGSGAA